MDKGITNRKQLAKRLKALRQANGWTQEELAYRSGLHSTYIGGIERGERNLGVDNLFKIAKALCKHLLFKNKNAKR